MFSGRFTVWHWAAWLALGVASLFLSTRSAAASPSWHEETLLAKGRPEQRLAGCLAVREGTAVVGVPGEAVSGTGEVGAARVFVRDGASWTLKQTLTPPEPRESASFFGGACAMSDDRLVVAAAGSGLTAGRVYVFARARDAFVLEQTLAANVSEARDYFGSSVAIDGERLVVSTPTQLAATVGGTVDVFLRSGTTWSRVQTIGDASARIFARGLALQGNLLSVEASTADFSRGLVRTYERRGATFEESDVLEASERLDTDSFGESIALFNDTLVVGDSLANGGRGGAAVYRRQAGAWGPSATLTAPSLDLADAFGRSVSRSGETLFVGAPLRAGRGRVFVFEPAGATWALQRELVATGLLNGSRFGATLSASDDVLLIGAPASDFHSGTAHVFRRGLGRGEPCTTAEGCVSGFCVDGMCCDVACGGGRTDDCQSCSRSRGGSVDGACGPVRPEIVCRPATSTCDVPEHCDGLTLNCPADGVVVSGAACSGGTCVLGRCDPSTSEAPTPETSVPAEPIETPAPNCACRMGASRSSPPALPFAFAAILLAMRRRRRSTRTRTGLAGLVAFVASLGLGAPSAHAASPSWQEQDHLTPSSQGDNQAGSCVAVRGDVAIVSAPLEDIPGPNGLLGNAGAVFVYHRKGTSWQLVQTLLKPNFATRDSFGSSCAMDADRIVIGERGAIDEGAAHVFKRSGDLWQLEQTIVANDAAYGDNFGEAVGLEGGTLVVGASSRGKGIGAIYTFIKTPSGWSQEGPPLADGAPGEFFGSSLAFDGSTLAVSRLTGTGAVYAYTRTAAGWGVPQTLVGTVVPTMRDRFGHSIAVEHDVLVASVQGQIGIGAAVVFRRNGGIWQEEATLTAAGRGSYFGSSLAISRATLFVGAWLRRSVFAFTHTGGVWTAPLEILANDPRPEPAFFGGSVAAHDDTLVVGATPAVADKPGEAYVFRLALRVGQECTSNAPCLRGFCVDGVCCGSACGAGAPSGCAVCSVAAGATADGICGPAPMTTRCRASTSSCDVTEQCDGLSLVCPADGVAANGTACAEGICLGGRCEPQQTTSSGPDAGTGAPPEEPDASGCGCHATDSSRPGLAGILLLTPLVAAVVRRKRRRRG